MKKVRNHAAPCNDTHLFASLFSCRLFYIIVPEVFSSKSTKQ